MDDREAQDERAELISRAFALITAKLEDATTIATDSQGRLPADELRRNAENLRELLCETATVVDCVAVLVAGPAPR